MAIWSENTGTLPLAVWGILLAAFLVDATITIARRMKTLEKWFQAHRSHAYQLAVQAGASRQKVTLGVIAINLVLVALAWITWTWPVALLATLVGVVVGLGVLWLWIVKGNRGILLGVVCSVFSPRPPLT